MLAATMAALKITRWGRLLGVAFLTSLCIRGTLVWAIPGNVLVHQPAFGEDSEAELPARLPYYRVEDHVRSADLEELAFRLRMLSYANAEVNAIRPAADRILLQEAVRRQMVEVHPRKRQYLLLTPRTEMHRPGDPSRIYALFLDRDEFRALGLTNIAGADQKQTFALLGIKHVQPPHRGRYSNERVRIGIYGFAEASNVPDGHQRLLTLSPRSGLVQDLLHFLRP